MGIREMVGENRRVVMGGAVAVLVVACLGLVAWSWTSGGEPSRSSAGRAFYTVDEGKSYFRDDSAKTPPFEHEGRQAVRALVYRCGDREFVGVLVRYAAQPLASRGGSTRGKQGSAGAGPGTAEVKPSPMGMEIKRPGETNWVRQYGSKEAMEIMRVRCPDGSSGTPVVVEP